jgi:hypothetical protein
MTCAINDYDNDDNNKDDKEHDDYDDYKRRGGDNNDGANNNQQTMGASYALPSDFKRLRGSTATTAGMTRKDDRSLTKMWDLHQQ